MKKKVSLQLERHVHAKLTHHHDAAGPTTAALRSPHEDMTIMK